MVAARAGDREEMQRCDELARTVAERLGQPTLDWMVAYTAALRALIAGDTNEAEHLARRAFKIGTAAGQPDAALFCRFQLDSASFQRGTYLDMDPPVDEQLAGAAYASVPTLPPSAVALAHLGAGRVDEARHMLEEFAATGFDRQLDSYWLFDMILWATAAIGCRDADSARQLFDLLAACPDQMAVTGIIASNPISHVLGGLLHVLGRFDEADAYFAKAAAFNARLHAKYLAALTNIEWARLLAKRKAAGDIDKARELLDSAYAAAVANGYTDVQRRATATGARLGQPLPSGGGQAAI
jgi:tetratricopeptide (TPR) repeat protein